MHVLRRSFSRANLVVEVSMTFSADPYDITDMEDFPAIFQKKKQYCPYRCPKKYILPRMRSQTWNDDKPVARP